MYSTVERVRVILNEVKDPSCDSEAPRILRLPPQDDTPTHNSYMALLGYVVGPPSV